MTCFTEEQIRENIDELQGVLASGTLTHTQDGTTVSYGDADDVRKRLQYWQELLKNLKGQQTGSFNINMDNGFNV